MFAMGYYLCSIVITAQTGMSFHHRVICFVLFVCIMGCEQKSSVLSSYVKPISPASEANVYRNNVFFEWRNTDIASTRLQIASDINFTTLLLDSFVASTNANFNGTSLLRFNTTYYWRIQAEPLAGDYIYSDARKFRVIDSRDSLTGNYNAVVYYQYWNQPTVLIDTSYNAGVSISKLNPDILRVVCNALGPLPDMLPYPNGNSFHYGNDGLVPVDSAFKSCIYEPQLSQITLEYYSGTVNPGYHYWITIYK